MSQTITPEKKQLVNTITSLEGLDQHDLVLAEVLLDIVNGPPQHPAVKPDRPDEHEFGSPHAFTTGLISGNFPYP